MPLPIPQGQAAGLQQATGAVPQSAAIQQLLPLLIAAKMQQQQGRPGGPGGTPVGPAVGNPGVPPVPGGNGAAMGTGQALAGPGGGSTGATSMGPTAGAVPQRSAPGPLPQSVPPSAAMGGMPVSPAPPNPEPTGSDGQDQQRPVAGNQVLPYIPRNPLGALLMGQQPLNQYQQQLGAQGGNVDPWQAVIAGMMNH